MKGKTSTMLTIMAAVVTIAALAYVLVAFNVVGPQPGRQPIPLQQFPGGGSVGGVVEQNPCSGINTLQLSVASLNPLNSSTFYTGPRVLVVPGEAPIGVGGTSGSATATGTLTSGTTLSFANVNPPCNPQAFSGTVYMMSDTTDDNSAAEVYTIPGTGASKIMKNTIGDELRLTIRALASGVSRSANQSEDVTEEGATAMSAGDVRDGVLDIEPGNIAYTAYGGMGLGVLWCYDSVDSAAFSDKSLSISSDNVPITEIDCNTYTKANSVDSCNRCWWSPEITTETGISKIRWRLANDGGSNAGSTSDPTLDFTDIQFVEQTGTGASTIKIDGYDTAGTAIGADQSTVTWDNS